VFLAHQRIEIRRPVFAGEDDIGHAAILRAAILATASQGAPADLPDN
jgi:hypothetical protein